MDLVTGFISRYDEFIKIKSRYLARDADEADELHQKANIVLWKHYSRLSVLPEPSVKAFLGKSMKNALIDIRRRENRIVSYDGLIEQPSFSCDGFEDAVINKHLVMSVIHHLTTLEQDIIFKTYFMDMDSVAIGKLLDMPPSTVRSKRMRANNKLKKLLKEEQN